MIRTTSELLESIEKVRLLLNNQGLDALNEDMLQIYLRIESLSSNIDTNTIMIKFSQEEFKELQNHIIAAKKYE